MAKEDKSIFFWMACWVLSMGLPVAAHYFYQSHVNDWWLLKLNWKGVGEDNFFAAALWPILIVYGRMVVTVRFLVLLVDFFGKINFVNS